MLNPTPRVKRTGAPDLNELTVRTLFDSEETPLLRYAFSLVGQRAVAEDIVQEVFLQLHARWGEIDSPRAWLFRSVRNRAYNHVRDHRREILSSDASDMQDTQRHSDPPDAVFLRLEAQGTLRQLLQELNDQDRELVTLKYFEGLAYRDISTRTGLSIGNVGYRLHHILKELATKLRPLGMDQSS
ncbi:MAG: RNA polymerase sigma factor [Planctomycetota bacterium]